MVPQPSEMSTGFEEAWIRVEAMGRQFPVCSSAAWTVLNHPNFATPSVLSVSRVDMSPSRYVFVALGLKVALFFPMSFSDLPSAAFSSIRSKRGLIACYIAYFQLNTLRYIH